MSVRFDIALARDMVSYSPVLAFLVPPLLEQWRLLIVARHVYSSQTA